VKITKSRLKEIIREELGQLNEYEAWDGDMKWMKGEIKDDMKSLEQKLQKKITTIEDNLELIGKKLGVKLKR